MILLLSLWLGAAKGQSLSSSSDTQEPSGENAEMATLYLYRPYIDFPPFLSSRILINGQTYKVRNGGMEVVSMSPGEVQIRTIDSGKTLRIHLEAGQSYYIQLAVHYHWLNCLLEATETTERFAKEQFPLLRDTGAE
jgi:hypothetical protein